MQDSTAPPPPDARHDDRDLLIAELGALTLPIMWMLRQRAVKAFEPLGIRPVKALTLGMIAEGIVSPKELGDVLQFAPSLMSSMIGDLEDRGWLERHADPDDRRRVRLAVTDAGRTTLRAMATAWHATSVSGAEHLDTDDLRNLVRILRMLLEAR